VWKEAKDKATGPVKEVFFYLRRRLPSLRRHGTIQPSGMLPELGNSLEKKGDTCAIPNLAGAAAPARPNIDPPLGTMKHGLHQHCYCTNDDQMAYLNYDIIT
jgi:hypothetical protein